MLTVEAPPEPAMLTIQRAALPDFQFSNCPVWCFGKSVALAEGAETGVLSSFDVSAGFNGATRPPGNIIARSPTTKSTLLSEIRATVSPLLIPSEDSCAAADLTRLSSWR